MSNPTLTINGSTRTISDGSDFRETVINAARDAGLGKFRVILDGREIDPADAPPQLSAGMSLEIKPYEEAGV
jgi:hypothetical protein